MSCLTDFFMVQSKMVIMYDNMLPCTFTELTVTVSQYDTTRG